MEETEEIKKRNIISPWRNVAEFNDLTEWIYGENSDSSTWQRALQELNVWINRRRSQCPAAIYATHAMLEVKLIDNDNDLSSAGRNRTELDKLRSLYAFALVRFFNFMSSTLQTHNMRSMYTTANEMGLESFVVDIRHICAHGTELPELSILRKTADYCLNWLHGYYWRVQSEKMIDANASCLKKRNKALQKCAKEFEHLCNLYATVLECYLNRCETLKDVKRKLRGRQLATFKEYWKNKNLKTINEAFDIIIMDMVAMFKTGMNRKPLIVLFAREFMKMKYIFTAAETHGNGVELEKLIGAVQNLFRFLAVYNIIEIILQRLFETAETTSEIADTVRSGAAFWAKHIVEGFAIFIRCRKMFNAKYEEECIGKFDYSALNFNEFSKNVRKTYIYSGINIKRSIIFGDTFRRPWVWHFNREFLEKRIKAVNSFTAQILPCLLPLVKPKMNDDEISRIQNLTEIYLNKSAENNAELTEKIQDSSEDKIYTLKDVLPMEKMESMITDIRTNGSEGFGGWRSVRYDEYDWSKCPIGHLPWN